MTSKFKIKFFLLQSYSIYRKDKKSQRNHESQFNCFLKKMTKFPLFFKFILFIICINFSINCKKNNIHCSTYLNAPDLLLYILYLSFSVFIRTYNNIVNE